MKRTFKYRILTDGERYRIQRRVWGIVWWRWVTIDEYGTASYALGRVAELAERDARQWRKLK